MLTTDEIVSNFSKSALSYCQADVVQKRAAAELTRFFQDESPSLIPGKCLEIGCGTGLLTQQMLALLPERQWHITDISNAMLKQCKAHLQSSQLVNESVTFALLNGECLSSIPQYALIASSMVLQWFINVEASLRQMQEHVQPGGVLLLSFPEMSSFTEWKSVCAKADIRYTGHALPHIDIVKKCFCPLSWDVRIMQNKIVTTHAQSIDFFKQLKLIGAHASAELQLKPFELKRLLTVWDSRFPNGVANTYNIVYLMARRICAN